MSNFTASSSNMPQAASGGARMVRLKVVLIGSSNSGKTTFLKANMTTEPLSAYNPSVGVTFSNHNSRLLGNHVDLFLHYVDTTEVAMNSLQYMAATLYATNLVLVFMDVTNRDSVSKAITFANHVKAMKGYNRLPQPM